MDKIIVKFLDKIDTQNVLCILISGSYATGLQNQNSDVDLRIITNENTKALKKVEYFEGIKFSYIEGNYEFFIKKINQEFTRNKKFEARVFSIGQIYKDNNNNLLNLKRVSQEVLSVPFDKISEIEKQFYYYELNEYYSYLKNEFNSENKTFTLVYFQFLNTCFINYCKLINYEHIIDIKINKILFKNDYAKANHFPEFPDSEFIELWIKSINISKKHYLKQAKIIINFLNKKFEDPYIKSLSIPF